MYIFVNCFSAFGTRKNSLISPIQTNGCMTTPLATSIVLKLPVALPQGVGEGCVEGVGVGIGEGSVAGVDAGGIKFLAL